MGSMCTRCVHVHGMRHGIHVHEEEEDEDMEVPLISIYLR